MEVKAAGYISSIRDVVQKGPLRVPDPRVLLWELTRPLDLDGFIVAFSHAMIAAIGCNTALYTLGNSVQAKAIKFYLLKYITKDSTAIAN
jgi:hypothetical protein